MRELGKSRQDVPGESFRWPVQKPGLWPFVPDGDVLERDAVAIDTRPAAARVGVHTISRTLQRRAGRGLAAASLAFDGGSFNGGHEVTGRFGLSLSPRPTAKTLAGCLKKRVTSPIRIRGAGKSRGRCASGLEMIVNARTHKEL